MTQKLVIRLELEADLAEKFLELKRRSGLVNNTDVLRLLLVQAYNKEVGA